MSDFRLASRPGHCTSGTPFEALVNAFEVHAIPRDPIYHYDGKHLTRTLSTDISSFIFVDVVGEWPLRE